MEEQKQAPVAPFTGYQKLVIFLLALTQFTVVLDFMVMSPLGDMMMKSMQITAQQFGIAVSAYAFSAGISGLLTAGFADKYDRKQLLLFFYGGFIIGTMFCAIVPNYPLLLAARIVTGIFGGVMGSISMAIVADLFSLQQRGKVMGFVQMGFGVSQVLGIPIGLYVANIWGWQMPFWGIVGMAVLIAIALFLQLQPIAEHLKLQKNNSAFQHLLQTLQQKNYQIGFLCTAFLSIGGFMMMPFGSAFAVNNLGLTQEQLPILFSITGVATLITMPLVGRMSDKVNKVKLFTISTVVAVVLINIYTRFGVMPFVVVAATNVMMMVGIMSRMIPSMALTSALPQMQDRGAFMSINSSLQQIAGGFGAMLAGLVIVQKDNFAPIEHYDWLAVIASVMMFVTIYLVYQINEIITNRPK